VAFPVVLGGFGCLNVFYPRSYILANIVGTQAKAVALDAFVMILLMLLMRVGLDDSRDGDEEMTAIALSEQQPGPVIERALQPVGQGKFWAVAPLGCCFKPCMVARHMNGRDLKCIAYLLSQFVYVGPSVVYVAAWIALEYPPTAMTTVRPVLKYMITVSALLAMYGLGVIYQISRGLLKDHFVTAKFLALKIPLWITAFQKLLLAPIATMMVDRGHYCLDATDLANHLDSSLLVLESLLMAFLISHAFPVSEIQQYRGRHLNIIGADFGTDSGDEASSSCSDKQ